MSKENLDKDRVVETIKTTGSDVEAKPLNVKKFQKSDSKLSEEEEKKILEENADSDDDAVRDDNV